MGALYLALALFRWRQNGKLVRVKRLEQEMQILEVYFLVVG